MSLAMVAEDEGQVAYLSNTGCYESPRAAGIARYPVGPCCRTAMIWRPELWRIRSRIRRRPRNAASRRCAMASLTRNLRGGRMPVRRQQKRL